MTKAGIEQQSSHRGQNRFLLLLLVGAALISAAKDLGRLHDITRGLFDIAASVQQTVLAAVQSPAKPSCPQTVAQSDNSAQPFHWNGRVAPDQLIEINGSNDGIEAQPAVGGELDVAIRKASHSDPSVAIQVAAGASEVAKSALQTGEHSRRSHTSDRGRSSLATQLVTIGVRNNPNRVNFIVHLPSAIASVSRTMNDQISAAWLRSDLRSSGVCPITISRVDAHSLNHRLSISTGYRQAMIPSREINARVGGANCTDAIEFKTARRLISLDLLQILRANIEAESLNGNTVRDVPRTFKGVVQRAMSAAPAMIEDAH